MQSFRALDMKSLVSVYLVMAALALGAEVFSFGQPFAAWAQSAPISLVGLVAGLAVLLSYAGVTWLCRATLRSAADLEKVFQALLTPLSYLQIIVLALVSGFIEEWLFRGIIQTHLGFVLASIIFGLAHLGPSVAQLYWGAVSFCLSLALGGIFAWTDSLWTVALIHSAINATVLWRLNRFQTSR